jgi:hypothetical protein
VNFESLMMNVPKTNKKNAPKTNKNKKNAPSAAPAPAPAASSVPAWQTGLGLGPNASFIEAQGKLKKLPQEQNTSQVYRLMRNAVQHGAFRSGLLQAYSKIYNASNYNSGKRAYDDKLQNLGKVAKNKNGTPRKNAVGNPVILYPKTQKANLNRSLEYLKHKTGQYA